MRLRSLNKQANIEDFTKFYEQVVDSNSDALYTRDRLEKWSSSIDKDKEKAHRYKEKD